MDKSINFNTYFEPDIIGEATPEFCYSTKEEVHKKLMEAHKDVLAGRVEPAEKVLLNSVKNIIFELSHNYL